MMKIVSGANARKYKKACENILRLYNIGRNPEAELSSKQAEMHRKALLIGLIISEEKDETKKKVLTEHLIGGKPIKELSEALGCGKTLLYRKKEEILSELAAFLFEVIIL